MKTKPLASVVVKLAPATTAVVPSARYNTPCDAVGNVVTDTLDTVEFPSTSVPANATAMLAASSAPLTEPTVATGVTAN